ncbi:MAG: Crp/Fnr family transcriptional regulator [Arenibacterium sp.]
MNTQHESNKRSNSAENRFGPLLSVGWLADQSEDFNAWAKEVGKPIRFNAGQYVYQGGDHPQGVYGLRSGALEIEFPLLGQEPVSLLRTTEGFWVGESGLLSRQPRVVSVKAVEESTLICLAVRDIRPFLDKNPKHWQAFYDLSHRNVETAVSLLAEALSLTVTARVCRRLLDMSENRREAHTTQEDLARLLGVARPTLRRSLNTLVAAGAIELKYRRISIVDRAVLRTFRNEQ